MTKLYKKQKKQEQQQQQCHQKIEDMGQIKGIQKITT